MGAVIEAFQDRLEELAQLLELVGMAQGAGIEDDGLEFRPLFGNPGRGAWLLGAEAVQRVGQALGKKPDMVGQGACADQQRPFDGAQTPGLPAFQTDRRWQPNGADQTPADVGVGKIDIAVGRHGTLYLSRGSKVWTTVVQ